jgi:predicted amidohydrolase
MVGPAQRLRVGVVQMSSQTQCPQNLARAADWVGRAAKDGADLVVLPENFAYLGPAEGRCALAERIDGGGPIVTAIAAMARSHKVVVVAGTIPEQSPDAARPYQTCAVFGPEGLLATYRKIHLFDVDLSASERYCESDTMTAGHEVIDVVAGGFRLGLSICYDLRFPELYRRLADRGSEIITVPAAFTLTTGKDHWHALLRARAIENQAYVVAAGQSGAHSGGRNTYGKSLIADPWGDVIAQCSDGEGIAVGVIERQRIDDVRARLPSLKHRRL